MNVITAIRQLLWPEIPEVDEELLERERQAEQKAANGFKILQEARLSYDKRKSFSGLDTMRSDIDEADRKMKEALGGG